MKKIGPTFTQELEAKGLLGLGFSWGNDTGELRFNDDVTAAERAAVEAVLAAHDPDAALPAPAPESVSRYQGREAMRLTPYGNPEDGVSLFDAAETLLAREDTPAYYVRAWEELQTFDFDSPMLIAVADELGLTREDRVSLFLFAASLKA
ncbi:hypothetical protein [Achromobacter sp. NFACC18-2]|uniref:hypothetical protein n=1 Tax=Achromobacter sp. NFACC18-2 TaxID=1564112 RepID=UPI0008B3D67A|nr:hypothetical protein [Achromobacter sp. NFACC18-2]SEJ85337.1 hypothetical protein SAMN03159494_03591 [Achromobacter sp. NFACC18-2]